ncbi:type II toxin-antitoxin system Phd/YefM family antitoxin [Novosphingobium terrae]|uniref:type II toxin-antitoxin system Phd/YefM family antitoxin n=1 Tax=Novosphingobium terrae TaxID=2726189 RepID=UPI001981C0A2|nr:type II toxin-antitoxin system Phd/YefM family antitoxin [Novosphingobium terrae]
MNTHFLSSKEFSRDPGRAKKAADDGAVFITNRNHPTHVLLRIEEYRKLTTSKGSIVDKLALVEAADIDFEVPRVGIGLKPADLS